MTWIKQNLAQVIVWLVGAIAVAFVFGASHAGLTAADERIELRQDQIERRMDKLDLVVEDLRDVAQDLRIQVGILKAENVHSRKFRRSP